MIHPSKDQELYHWLRWADEHGNSFVRAVAQAALVADIKHYNLLRPVLLKLKEEESRSAASSGVLDGELEEDKSHDPSSPRIQ